MNRYIPYAAICCPQKSRKAAACCGLLHTFIEQVCCINRAQKATFHSRGMLRPTAQINHPRQKWRARRIAMRPALSILTGTRLDVSVLSLDALLPTLNWISWAGLIAISPAQPFPTRRINQRGHVPACVGYAHLAHDGMPTGTNNTLESL